MSKVDLFAAHRERMKADRANNGGAAKYWRSLDSRVESDQTRRWLDEEFPHGLAPEEFGEVTHDGQEAKPGFARREVLKLMSASMALAGVGTACVRRPEEEILPYVSQPEDVIPGIANFYASAMPSPWGASGLLVESHEGRPTKVEGNPDHPVNAGKAGVFEQASVLQLYDPDRSRFPRKGGAKSTWAAFDKEFAQVLQGAASSQGNGLAFLLGTDGGPTEARLKKAIRAKLPQTQFFHYDPLTPDNTQKGAEMAFGPGARVHYNIERAQVICAIDSNFLVEGPEALRHAHGFAQKRNAELVQSVRSAANMNRLYAVEPSFSPTGASADNRLRVAGRDIPGFLLALADELSRLGVAVQGAAGYKASNEKFIPALAKDLKKNAGNAVLVVGERQPAAVHALAHAINHALNAFTNQVAVITKPAQGEVQTTTDEDGNETTTTAFARHTSSHEALAGLVAALNAGKVNTLVVLGPNPAYTAPGALGFADAAKKAKVFIHGGLYADETAQVAGWHIPLAHYLESWDDTVAWDGTVSVVQPTIKPMWGARHKNEILASFAGEAGSDLDLVKASHNAGRSAWRTALHKGVVSAKARVAVPAAAPTASTEAVKKLVQKPASNDDLDVVFRPDAKVLDGRFANLGWLQELPEPMSKLTWDNALLIGPTLARELGVKSRVFKNNYEADEVAVTVGDKTVNVPAFVLPGLAPHTVELCLGYGRADAAGVVAGGVGVDVSPLLPKSGAHVAAGKLSRTGKIIILASTQDHFAVDGEPVKEADSYFVGMPIQELKSMNTGYAEKRPLSVSTNVQGYRNATDFAKKGQLRVISDGNLVEPDALQGRPTGPDKPIQPTKPFPYNGTDKLEQMWVAKRVKTHTWGAEQQWGLAIDMTVCTTCNACVTACQAENNIPVVGKDMVLMGREMHWIRIDRYFTGDVDAPEALSQPVGCLHCENAPCEPVCPVAATVHDTEGLNAMVYNRCIGTRYCANNCPVKVRRFNYFDFTKTAHLYVEEQAKERHKVLKLQRNPNVSVRFRGVIEKCTYCTQRIQEAKFKAKRNGEDSKNLKDGSITPACEQTCPTGAIVFGNINDANSRVAKLKKLDRNYEMLSELNIRPRTSYIARLKNPNPELG